MKYCLYIQDRQSTDELWSESYSPEPYNIYETFEEAKKDKDKLEDKTDKLHRWFIRKISDKLAEFYA
jgi:hypothetical protein